MKEDKMELPNSVRKFINHIKKIKNFIYNKMFIPVVNFIKATYIVVKAIVTSAAFRYIVFAVIVGFATFKITWKAQEIYIERLEKLVNSEKFIGSVNELLRKLKMTHTRYNDAMKEELLTRWVSMYSNTTYMLGGARRYNRYDCSLAVLDYLRSWGANVAYENVKNMTIRAKNLADRGELKIRRNLRQVKPGDIITLRYATSWHTGVV